MRGGRDGGERGVRGRRCGRGGGRIQTMINGVDVSDPTRNFTANEWNSLGWNGGRAYVAQTWERINRIRSGGQGGGHYAGRGYGRGGGLFNVNELNAKKVGEHDEGYQVEHRHGQGEQGLGQGRGSGHGGDRIGCNGTRSVRGAYH